MTNETNRISAIMMHCLELKACWLYRACICAHMSHPGCMSQHVISRACSVHDADHHHHHLVQRSCTKIKMICFSYYICFPLEGAILPCKSMGVHLNRVGESLI